MQNLLSKIFIYDFEKRINFQQLFEHPLLKNYETVLKKEITFYNSAAYE